MTMVSNEMTKLVKALVSRNIPFELGIQELTSSLQVFYPSKTDCVCDVICHEFSYGGKQGLLEIMGCTKNGDDVEGCLNADEVVARISTYAWSHR